MARLCAQQFGARIGNCEVRRRHAAKVAQPPFWMYESCIHELTCINPAMFTAASHAPLNLSAHIGARTDTSGIGMFLTELFGVGGHSPKHVGRKEPPCKCLACWRRVGHASLQGAIAGFVATAVIGFIGPSRRSTWRADTAPGQHDGYSGFCWAIFCASPAI
jgi:hypothetical protein